MTLCFIVLSLSGSLSSFFTFPNLNLSFCFLRDFRLRVFQDEQSSVAMLKKHQILEQAVEDYADTVHQLSSTSRGLVAAEHPDR